jgi:hypothetical protein
MTKPTDSAKFWPKPTCCPNAQRFPLVFAMTSRTTDQDGPVVAFWSWSVAVPDMSDDGHSDRAGFASPPAPTHCPFCQAPLPRLRRRAKPPAPLCEPADHYCLTCSERLMGCECYPAPCGWEAVP